MSRDTYRFDNGLCSSCQWLVLPAKLFIESLALILCCDCCIIKLEPGLAIWAYVGVVVAPMDASRVHQDTVQLVQVPDIAVCLQSSNQVTDSNTRPGSLHTWFATVLESHTWLHWGLQKHS